MPEVCKNIEIKPKLTPLKAEELDNRTANTTKEARLDLNQDLAPGVWERGQQAFLDLSILTLTPAAVSTRTTYNNLRDLTVKIFPQVCKDREIEPKLTPLTGEELDSSTGNTTNEGRLDIKQDFACGGV